MSETYTAVQAPPSDTMFDLALVDEFAVNLFCGVGVQFDVATSDADLVHKPCNSRGQRSFHGTARIISILKLNKPIREALCEGSELCSSVKSPGVQHVTILVDYL